jgi:glutathione S-transferase
MLVRHGQRTAPLLVTARGTIRDSTAILRYADELVGEERRLFPSAQPARTEVEELEESFDRKLGPAARRLAYFHLLDDARAMGHLVGARIGRAERAAFRLGLPAIVGVIRRGYRVDPEGARRSEQRIDAIFDEVEMRLARGDRYLVGDRLTAADVTFAALAAPVLLPAEYGWPLPSIENAPPGLRALAARLGARGAGAFALRLYREDRLASRVVA